MKPADKRMKVECGIDVTLVTFNDVQILGEQQINELHDMLTPVIEKNEGKKLVLNFANVQFMSSAFLGLLIRVHKKVCEQGGQLQLCNLNPRIHKIFEITRLTQVFDIS